MGVNAKCRNCGKDADSDSFKLHYKFKMMVCPNCFSGKTEQQQQKAAVQKKETPVRPAGWDHEDEYLEKMSRLKRKDENNNFTKIPGTDQVMYTCVSCKYAFRYSPLKKIPPNCPYCNSEIPKLRLYNFL